MTLWNVLCKQIVVEFKILIRNFLGALYNKRSQSQQLQR